MPSFGAVLTLIGAGLVVSGLAPSDDASTEQILGSRLRAVMPERPCAIITADHGQDVQAAVLAAGCTLLYKPLKPLALKSVMARMLAGRAEAELG